MLGDVRQGDFTLIPPWTSGARLAPSVCAKSWSVCVPGWNEPVLLQRRMQPYASPPNPPTSKAGMEGCSSAALDNP